jgi:Bax protein
MIKKLFRTKVFILGLLVLSLCANAQNSAYINNHRVVAEVLAKTYGIPAAVILAVAAIESSGGTCATARVLNNHFGIEGDNEFVTPSGFSSRYKQYDNALASYIDFCQLITRKRFYPRLKNNQNCKAWVKAISKCGYSEVPQQWEQKVFSVLSRIEYSRNFASK